MYKKILVAVDGSDISRKTLKVAIDEAKVWGSDLIAVYVLETGMFEDIPADQKMEYIRNLFEQQGNNVFEYAEDLGREAGVKVDTIFKEGHAGIEIINAAGETGADLIVLGSHGRSDIEKILLGSASAHVVHHSAVSTLVVRV